MNHVIYVIYLRRGSGAMTVRLSTCVLGSGQARPSGRGEDGVVDASMSMMMHDDHGHGWRPTDAGGDMGGRGWMDLLREQEMSG